MRTSDWQKWCCRCQSLNGFDPARPDFCMICFQRRIPVPPQLLREHEDLIIKLGEVMTA